MTQMKLSEMIENTDQSVIDLSQNRKFQRNVFLFTLLNTLNDVSLQKDQLLIMMTNHIKYLNDVLIHSDCINRKILFQLADEKMSSCLFYMIFK
ncbi:hypothetical protein EMPG_14888 [Blastomyces silverae]|uniref:Uncharacterized protein n=1 Tax=Blastomyces silverae TaxID=2060906 RepID=A0A0H1BDY4_9EURO|nr:hypothetical protein EMPG_14888 [Blastomyces silverae]